MTITITIEAQNAAEAAELVHDLADTISRMSPEQIPPDTTVSTLEKPETAKDTKPPKTEKSEKKATPADEEEGVPDISDEELRAVARKVGKTQEKKDQIKALLAEYDVPNITAVPKAARPEFLARLEEIGQ